MQVNQFSKDWKEVRSVKQNSIKIINHIKTVQICYFIAFVKLQLFKITFVYLNIIYQSNQSSF